MAARVFYHASVVFITGRRSEKSAAMLWKKSRDDSFLSTLFFRLLLVRIARRREKRLQKKPAYKVALELTGLCIYMLKDAYEETTEKVLLYGLIDSLYRSQ